MILSYEGVRFFLKHSLSIWLVDLWNTNIKWHSTRYLGFPVLKTVPRDHTRSSFLSVVWLIILSNVLMFTLSLHFLQHSLLFVTSRLFRYLVVLSEGRTSQKIRLLSSYPYSVIYLDLPLWRYVLIVIHDFRSLSSLVPYAFCKKVSRSYWSFFYYLLVTWWITVHWYLISNFERLTSKEKSLWTPNGISNNLVYLSGNTPITSSLWSFECTE